MLFGRSVPIPGPLDDFPTHEPKFWIPLADTLHAGSRMRSLIGSRRRDVFLVDDRIGRTDACHINTCINACKDDVDRDAGACENGLTGEDLRVTHNQI